MSAALAAQADVCPKAHELPLVPAASVRLAQADYVAEVEFDNRRSPWREGLAAVRWPSCLPSRSGPRARVGAQLVIRLVYGAVTRARRAWRIVSTTRTASARAASCQRSSAPA